MIVQLSADMEALVEKRVASRRFGSASAVLAEALVALEKQDAHDLAELEHFQAGIQQSVDEADRGDFVDAEEMFAELRERGRVMRHSAA